MTDLVVHRFGDPTRPPMLLLHGLTEAGTAWPDAVRRWSAEWDIHAVDQRGHGRSPRFTDEQLARSPEVWLSDAVAVAREVKAATGRSPVVLGHSLGGLMALRLGDQHPDLVRALVLQDPARPGGEWRVDPQFVAAQEEFLDTFAGGTAAEKQRMRVDSGWTPDEIDAWADCKPLVDRAMVRRALFLGSGEWEAVFERLQMPTLVVGPQHGEMLPRGVTNPQVRVVELAGVGHCVRRDDPDAFHAVVDPFLAAVTRSEKVV